MNKLNIVKKLKSSSMAVFTPSNIAAFFDKNIESARVLLSRLTKEGILVRVKRGFYCLPSTNVLSVASNVYPPCYVSLWAAFEHYGTTTQSPRIIDVINPNKSRKTRISLEEGVFTLRFVKTQRSLIYGIKKVYLDGKIAFIAEKEKAIVDGLMFNKYIPIGEIVEAIKDDVYVDRLVEYAQRSKKQVVMKRLGYLLDQEGFRCHPDDFQELSDTFIPLVPSFPRRGSYDSKWYVIDNRGVK